MKKEYRKEEEQTKQKNGGREEEGRFNTFSVKVSRDWESANSGGD